ncbi:MULTISPECIES: condensation domain-containing protein [Rhodococcus]|uniref:condensation domain-containing protein n=1 Tax=Rhodococcus TaxID=1827 RepID=UPI0021573175|nr:MULTISPECIES: condensation domain-containing protein [Rhodococcus]UUK33958.1 condensation domain-containing protein [Rhodococcus opacus]
MTGALSLPSDRPRPEKWSYGAARLPFAIAPAVHGALLEAARTHHTGLFTALHAAVTLLLARLSGATDIAIGAPVAGHGHPSLDDVVGMFVNTVVLRTQVESTTTFDDLVARCSGHRVAGVRARGCAVRAPGGDPRSRTVTVVAPVLPGRDLARKLRPRRTRCRRTHFDITPSPLDIAKCDPHFYFTERHDGTGAPDGIDAKLVYSTDLFNKGLRAVLSTRSEL